MQRMSENVEPEHDPPMHQRLVLWAVGVIAVFQAVGGFLGTISGMRSWLSPIRSIVLTALIVAIAIALHVVLGQRPVKWVNGGEICEIRGIQRSHFLALIGLLSLLWAPYLYQSSDPPLVTADPSLVVEVNEIPNIFETTLEIGNTGVAGIVKVSDLVMTSSHQECPYFVPPVSGAPINTIVTKVQVDSSNSTHSLIDTDHVYGSGEIDRFVVLAFNQEPGIYTFQFEFDYEFVGSGEGTKRYVSKALETGHCFLDVDLTHPENAGGGVHEMPARALLMIERYLDSPWDGASTEDVRRWAQENYPPCQQLREDAQAGYMSVGWEPINWENPCRF